MQIQISWLLQKPADLDLHCLQKQDISGFSRTRVKRGFLFRREANTILREMYNGKSESRPYLCVTADILINVLHKCCCLSSPLPNIWILFKWVNLIAMVTKIVGKYECKTETLHNSSKYQLWQQFTQVSIVAHGPLVYILSTVFQSFQEHDWMTRLI